MAHVNLTQFEKGLRELAQKFGRDTVLPDLELVAEEFLNRVIDAPIPSDMRRLANSSAVVREGPAKVVFGFNSVYAAFQDQPTRSGGVVTVRPRRKRILYVPLNQRGKLLHRRGMNPATEGLVWGKDYVLKREVKIPIKPYGSEIGPNHYFSGTLKREAGDMLEALARLVKRRMGAEGGNV